VPWEAETYLHRIGRAGRFGSYGVAVSLPSEGLELDILRNIAFQTGSQISILPYNPAAKDCLPDLWKIQQVVTKISFFFQVKRVSVLKSVFELPC
jgi:superfamily II DNA/RNA helicase